MNRWAVIVSTYGSSSERLMHTLRSLTLGTSVPHDLWVRGAVEDYWQQCEQRHIAEQFGARYMEAARWRHWEAASAFQVVDNPMAVLMKDDLILPQGWLESIEYFWDSNQGVPIGLAGLTFVEAWELVACGLLETEDDMWRVGLGVETRAQLAKLAFDRGATITHGIAEPYPMRSIGACPFAYAVNREQWEGLGAPLCCGPGDTSVLYGALLARNGFLSTLLPWPVVLHRKCASTREYCAAHGLESLWDPKAQGRFWHSAVLEEDFVRRWGATFKEVEAVGNRDLAELDKRWHIEKLACRYPAQET